METDLGERINPPQIQIYELASMSPEDRDRIMQRSNVDIGGVKANVLPIIDDIRGRGDAAVIDYIREFDEVELTPGEFKVSAEEIKEAYKKIDPLMLEAIEKQIEFSRKFHREQASHINMEWEKETAPGLLLGERKTPIESVGLYVPGGSAPLPSVAQILAVPAQIAGVERIVVMTPPGENAAVIVAADMAGATEIHRVGGVAAIAALAYGTETIKSVDKIVGPGNKYVAAAKSLVSENVAIDMMAGPSEVLIIADEEANPAFCAADILSACEHDPNAAGVLVTWSEDIAQQVQSEIERQTSELDRREIVEQSLAGYSAIILVKNEEEAVEFTNKYAPEHLEVVTKNPRKLLSRLKYAGSAFLGPWGGKAIGDFATGANHVLPTGTGARVESPIGVGTYLTTMQIQEVSEEALESLSEIMIPLANLEGLGAHRHTIEIRLGK